MMVAQLVGPRDKVGRVVSGRLREAAPMEAVAARKVVPIFRRGRAQPVTHAGVVAVVKELTRPAGRRVSVEADGAGRRSVSGSVVRRVAVGRAAASRGEERVERLGVKRAGGADITAHANDGAALVRRQGAPGVPCPLDEQTGGRGLDSGEGAKAVARLGGCSDDVLQKAGQVEVAIEDAYELGSRHA